MFSLFGPLTKSKESNPWEDLFAFTFFPSAEANGQVLRQGKKLLAFSGRRKQRKTPFWDREGLFAFPPPQQPLVVYSSPCRSAARGAFRFARFLVVSVRFFRFGPVGRPSCKKQLFWLDLVIVSLLVSKVASDFWVPLASCSSTSTEHPLGAEVCEPGKRRETWQNELHQKKNIRKNNFSCSPK